MDKHEWFIQCDCGVEGLLLSEEEEQEEDFRINDLYLSFWSYGHHFTSFKYRLGLIWKILKTGTPYCDSIIFNEKKQDELIEILLKKRMRDREETNNEGNSSWTVESENTPNIETLNKRSKEGKTNSD